MFRIRKVFFGCSLFLLICISGVSYAQKSGSILQLVFCSDVHFGLTKPIFRGQKNVSSASVNVAMIEQMNSLPNDILPIDGGVGSGQKIGGVEGVIITGDICNRQETEANIQSATISWKQFEDDYEGKLHLFNKMGKKAPLLLTPGNHDISNAIGFHRPMQPLTDNASMVGIYNLEMKPIQPITAQNFDFIKNKIHYSVDMGGIHLMFISAWPDSSERVWMGQDLNKIADTMPVFIFTHSFPNVEARFFQNPKGDHSINQTDEFENLVEEMYKDGVNVKGSTQIEQEGFVNFLQSHPNIKAYFHGHSNFAEFYNWQNNDNGFSLPCFRADSPMKGKLSSKDETKLSFNLISIDPDNRKMTVRECLWNTHPTQSSQSIEWGIEKTLMF